MNNFFKQKLLFLSIISLFLPLFVFGMEQQHSLEVLDLEHEGQPHHRNLRRNNSWPELPSDKFEKLNEKFTQHTTLVEEQLKSMQQEYLKSEERFIREIRQLYLNRKAGSGITFKNIKEKLHPSEADPYNESFDYSIDPDTSHLSKSNTINLHDKSDEDASDGELTTDEGSNLNYPHNSMGFEAVCYELQEEPVQQLVPTEYLANEEFNSILTTGNNKEDKKYHPGTKELLALIELQQRQINTLQEELEAKRTHEFTEKTEPKREPRKKRSKSVKSVKGRTGKNKKTTKNQVEHDFELSSGPDTTSPKLIEKLKEKKPLMKKSECKKLSMEFETQLKRLRELMGIETKDK